jgi:hypothetical protein
LVSVGQVTKKFLIFKAAAIVYAIFIPYCFTFFVLYWSLYKAALTNNIIRYCVAIAIWAIHFLWNLLMASGAPGFLLIFKLFSWRSV